MVISRRAEQETVIRWDRLDRVVSIWSADPAVWHRAATLGLEIVQDTRRAGRVTGRGYRVPLGRFRWGLKRAVPSLSGRRPPSRRTGPADATQI